MPFRLPMGDLSQYQPRGARDDLMSALKGVDDKVDWLGAVDEIGRVAISFNVWREATKSGPTIKDVRARLEAVHSAAAAMRKALSCLDDVALDWFLMNPGAVPFGLCAASFCPVEVAANIGPDFSEARKIAADNLPVAVAPGHTLPSGMVFDLRATLTLTMARVASVEKMAAVALVAFNGFFAGNRGGAKTAVEWLVDSAKDNLVAGCWEVAEEYLAPKMMAGSFWGESPFATFVRAVFEYATGESADGDGNSLDRSVRTIGKELAASRTPELDDINTQLRQGHMKT